MNTEREQLEKKLEVLATRELSALSLLRAPGTLEARVLAAIAQQQAAAAHRGFAQWAWWLKALFIVAALLAVYLLSGPSVTVFAGAERELAQVGQSSAVSALTGWWGALRSLLGGARTIADAIPDSWIIAVGALLAFCFATLMAGGVFAYRTINKVSP